MDNHDSRESAFTPEASTDERAFPSPPAPRPAPRVAEPGTAAAEPPSDPRFATMRAEEIYWAGVAHGARAAAGRLRHPHMPAGARPGLDGGEGAGLTRSSLEPSLVSNKLSPEESGEPLHPPGPLPPARERSRALRHDGWTPEKESRFITTLADTGVVADACRAAGMSRDAAYTRRRSASGRAFALAWEAALLVSRSAIADDAMGRARHGVVDRVYRGGELVAERHRYDNRLTMAVLTRLDRQAEGLGEGAAVARAIAQEFDRFLDILPLGVAGAEAFLAARFGGWTEEPPSPRGERPAPGTEQALLARLASYERCGAGLPAELDTSDLDPAEMESWTAGQIERAELGNVLEKLADEDWPDWAREPCPGCPECGCEAPPAGTEEGEADTANGMCKLRKLYLRYYPEAADADLPYEQPEEDDFAGCGVWYDEETGGWLTDFPPPDDFFGWGDGIPGDPDYRRPLTAREAAEMERRQEAGELDEDDSESFDEDNQEDEDDGEEDPEARLMAQTAARDRFFGFAADESDAEEERE